MKNKLLMLASVLLLFAFSLGSVMHVAASDGETPPGEETITINIWDPQGREDYNLRVIVSGKFTLDVGETTTLTFTFESKGYVRAESFGQKDGSTDIAQGSNFKVISSEPPVLSADVTAVKPGMGTLVFLMKGQYEECLGGWVDTEEALEVPITVRGAEFTLSPEKAALDIGETQAFEVRYPSNYPGEEAGEWATEDPSVATVRDGVVTAVFTGTTTVTYTNLSTGYVASAAVEVKPPDISLSPKTAEIYVGSKHSFNVIFPSWFTTDKSGTWESSNPAVATVEDGTATGLAPGTTTITFTHTATGATASAELTVHKRPTPPASSSSSAPPRVASPAAISPNTPSDSNTTPFIVTMPPASSSETSSSETSSSSSSSSSSPAPAPTITGETQISLPMGYARHVEPYSIQPSSGVEVSLKAGGTGATFSGGNLTIPAGLAPGDYTLVLTAAGKGGTTSLTVTLTVFPVYPTITGPGTIQAYAGGSASQAYTIDGLAGTTAYISTQPGKNTAGATLSGSGQTVTVNIPKTLPVGTYSVTLVADTGGYTVEKTISVVVTEAVSVTASSSSQTGFTLKESESLTIITFAATGGTAPYTYTFANLPAGFSVLDADRIMKTGNMATGTYTFTVTATDANGLTGTLDVTVTIVPDIP